MEQLLIELTRQIAELNCRIRNAMLANPLVAPGTVPATPTVTGGNLSAAPRNDATPGAAPIGPPIYPPAAKDGVIIFNNTRQARVRAIQQAGNINTQLVDADSSRRLLYFNGFASAVFLNVRPMSAIDDGWLIGNSAANGLLLFDSIDSSALCESAWFGYNNANWGIGIIEAW